ncbi:hypothetical protein [Methyloglobulus morosus]|uniref:hypothetical protein n=1 Tax=Methyloglobulus morosus TaxID=1410681 RepID=UPI000567E265|nr:hypothetical protein [Methyloglobulus morosus]
MFLIFSSLFPHAVSRLTDCYKKAVVSSPNQRHGQTKTISAIPDLPGTYRNVNVRPVIGSSLGAEVRYKRKNPRRSALHGTPWMERIGLLVEAVCLRLTNKNQP